MAYNEKAGCPIQREKWRIRKARKIARGQSQADNARRRAQARNARPDWVDKATMDVLHSERVACDLVTGIKHHVDHIWPLNGELWSGLDVPWNTAIIPAAENIRKGNKSPLEFYK